jgi:hypothetical protein
MTVSYALHTGVLELTAKCSSEEAEAHHDALASHGNHSDCPLSCQVNLAQNSHKMARRLFLAFSGRFFDADVGMPHSGAPPGTHGLKDPL